jgi:hypothetical protein
MRILFMNAIMGATETVMKGRLIRKWIEEGYRNYGRDPWFFLRELAQNSRDAGARNVWVSVNQTGPEQEVITFLDDGSGMGFSHARQFLFRLYASSKTNQKYSAGMYGIGFWTILRFRPDRIIIESRTGTEAWSIEMDSEFNIRHPSCSLDQKGTRVTLIRQSQSSDPERFADTAKERTIHYCAYLRRNDHRASPLPVFFDQERISREFQLPMVFGSRFKQGPVEGLVGFNHQPRVILYARGLPVWEGTRLDELFHLPPETETESEIGPGLAPVFLINGNHLDVNISRKTIMENRALEKVRKIAEREMSDLIDRYANRAYPHSWHQKLGIRLKRLARKWEPRFWLTLLLSLMILIPLEIVVLKALLPGAAEPKTVFGPPPANDFLQTNKRPYSGATVLPFSRTRPLDMSYIPGRNIWFKVFTADAYDLKHGFIRSVEQPTRSPADNPACFSESISVRLQIPGQGRMYLPLPVGHVIVPGSLTVNGFPFRGIQQSPGGELTLDLAIPKGDIRYSCCPKPRDSLPQESGSGIWTRIPLELRFPDRFNPALRNALELDAEERIQVAVDLTIDNLEYDTSSRTARAFQQAGNESDWLERVLTIEKGDCDIINGLTVLLLRKMDIPARLVVGLVGINGSIQGSLHAWTEYRLQGWKILDTSGLVNRASFQISKPQSRESLSPAEPDSSRSWIYLLATILICLVPVLILGFRKRRGQSRHYDRIHPDIKSNLARMAIGALLQPRLWSVRSNFREYRIIPTLKGPSLSLNGILDLARQGKLLAGGPDNPLSKRFINHGHTVLNLDDHIYAGLIRLVPGVIDLNLIRDLRAGESDGIRIPGLIDFLEQTNQTIKAISKTLPACLISPGLTHRDMMIVTFPKSAVSPGAVLRMLCRLTSGTRNGYPEQFMAINPVSRRIRDLAELHSTNPPLARFRIVSEIIGQAGRPESQKARWMKTLSRHLLKENSGR